MLMFCIFLAVMMRYSTASNNYWFIAWPGTIVHEMMHYTVAFLTFGNPNGFSVIPKTAENGTQVLGSVSCETLNWFNSLPIGLAPILGLPLAYWLSTKVHLDMTATGLFWVWVISSIIAQSVPSGPDFRIAFYNPAGIAVWGGIVFLVLK